MLRLHLANTRGNILREDLSVLETDPIELQRQHEDFLSELHRLCREHGGVGIAANQVGIRANFFFLTEGAKIPVKSGNKFTSQLCVNPTWEPDPKSKREVGHEGCMSLRGRDFLAERYTVIRATWKNALGHPQKKTLKGWAARVFQHEHDHLIGRLLTDHAEEIKIR